MVYNRSVTEILNMPPRSLISWLDENFVKELPMPETSTEFAQHNHLLGELANTYAYLTSLHSVAQIMVREAKRQTQDKDYINDCIDRRDVIESYINVVKMQYTAFSRMITVRKQADDEMRMMSQT